MMPSGAFTEPDLRKGVLHQQPGLRQTVLAVFGSDDDPVERVCDRARLLLAGRPVVVWEADPLTFTFTYVSPEAEALLGHPSQSWLEPGFWSSRVVHPADAGDALSHCAMATAAGMDHDFEYRACTAKGGVILVHDIVHVVKGPLGFASRLRGMMLPVVPAS